MSGLSAIGKGAAATSESILSWGSPLSIFLLLVGIAAIITGILVILHKRHKKERKALSRDDGWGWYKGYSSVAQDGHDSLNDPMYTKDKYAATKGPRLVMSMREMESGAPAGVVTNESHSLAGQTVRP